MWDFDHEVWGRSLYFERNWWPLKIIAHHACFPPSIVVKVVKPIVSALMDKHARSRTLMHDVPESEIPGVLSSCGIQKYMLPTQLERTVLLDQVKWIASQRAAELEDI
jgi:hypothetical protein